MKKKIKIIVIVALILIILVPYIFVEGNTLLFGSEFKNQYKQTNMIDDIEYYKVFIIQIKLPKCIMWNQTMKQVILFGSKRKVKMENDKMDYGMVTVW